jgi:hypothetical protein
MELTFTGRIKQKSCELFYIFNFILHIYLLLIPIVKIFFCRTENGMKKNRTE